MNRLELLKLIAAAPKNLKGYDELLAYARNIYKQVMGIFPEGIDNIAIKNAAKNIANQRDPKKVVQFPQGGKDKTDFFSTRPDPRVKQPPGAKMDVIRAHENLSGGANYAKGDTKYNADILADEIAMQRGIIKNLDDADLIDTELKTELYGEAYDYLTKLNMLNNPSAIKPRPPGKGEFGITTLDDAGKPLETKTTTPEGIMDVLMGGKTKKGELFNISGQKGKFLTEDEFARELESSVMNFKQNSPGFNLQLIPELKKPGAKAYNPFPNEQGDKFLTDNQRQKTLSSLEKIMKNEEYQRRYADNFADLMEEGDDVIEFAPDTFKIDPPKKAEGGRIGFSGGGAGYAGDQTEQSQPGGQKDMPRNTGFQPIFPMPQKNIPGSGGIKELRQFLQAVGAPELGMGYNFPVGQSGILGVGVAPSGNVGAQLKIPLSGGRFGFKDGSKPKSPGRRTFIKTMAGLASLPFVGKLFKPAAKVAEAGPAIAEGVKLGFDKFMMLVDKIKRLGRKTDRVTQKEREVGYTYQGKDGSEYELVEDLTTGDVRITKDKPGGMTVGDKSLDVIEDRSTFYLKRNQADETTKGKKPRDEYDEVKEIPGPDGTFDDVDNIDNETVTEILEELGETRTKKASGGLAYMLGE